MTRLLPTQEVRVSPTKKRLKRLLSPLVRRALGRGEAGFELPPQLWRLNPSPAGHLSFLGNDLHALAEEHGTPLHVVFPDALRRNVGRFRDGEAAGDRPDRAPEVELFYSYKTHPIPGVLEALHRLGVGAEVISPFELWLALRLGVAPQRILYNGAGKDRGALEEAVRVGVGLINVNSPEELRALAEVARQAGRVPRIGLRIAASQGWSGQFGVEVGPAALAFFREALSHPTVRVVGLHAHFGLPLTRERQLSGFVGEVLGFVDQLWRELSFLPELLDLGGSLATPTVAPIRPWRRRLAQAFACPIPPADPISTLSIEQYISGVRAQLRSHCARRGWTVPRLLLEPGRALSGNASMLITSVLTTRSAHPEPGPDFAVLDAGIHVADTARYERHQLFCLNRANEPPSSVFRLVGPLCTPGDVLYDAYPLPPVRPGDTLALMDAGAYFVPFETCFSYPRPAVIELEAGGARLLRRRETFDDLVQRDLPPPAARLAPLELVHV